MVDFWAILYSIDTFIYNIKNIQNYLLTIDLQ